MNFKKASFLICIMMFLVTAPMAADKTGGISGHWEGKIQLPTMALDVKVDLKQDASGSWSGDISIPLQNAKDLPLKEITVKGQSIRFMISGVPGDPTFSGIHDEEGGTIKGEFVQGGQNFSFELKRTDSPALKARSALKDFPQVISAGMEALNVPGVAMAVVFNDTVVFSDGFGFRNVEKKQPMTADTLLAIGSSSKAFTTFALGILVDQGRMEWDTPVREYIPWFRLQDPFMGERMTPRDMVTHRSGLPRHDLVWYNNFSSDRKEFVKRLAYLEPSAGLREKFQYNNLMYLSAGYLVEVLTHDQWESAIRSLVFQPLGMLRSNFSVIDSQKDDNFAMPYREEKGLIKAIPFRNISNIGPAGSINSSVNEMSHWLMTHLYNGRYQGKQVINPATLAQMHSAQMPVGNTSNDPRISSMDYGMGWFIDHYRGIQRVHHGGNIDGFSCLVSLLPAKGFGFVVLVNKDAAALPELLVRTATDRLLDLESVDWIGEAAKRKKEMAVETGKAEEKKGERQIKGTRPSHHLDNYAGTYHHPGYGDLEVKLQNHSLSFTYNGIVTPLDHWHYDTFNGRKLKDPTFADMKLTFHTDVNGYIHALSAPFEPRVKDIVFLKQPDMKYRDPGFLQRFVGEYTLAGEQTTITLKGDVLTIRTLNQRPFELVPGLQDEFHFKEFKIIGLKFIQDKAGNVTGFEVYQPQGVFTAKKNK